MHDAGRSGIATGPQPAKWKQAWSATVDGALFASPVVYDTRVIAATENDSVYAFDTATGHELWRRHLGEPLAKPTLSCTNIQPSGITSTPVIDVSAGTVYAVGFIRGGKPQHNLFALNLNDGTVRWSRAVDPPGADPLFAQQRGALTLANKRVYIPFGGLAGDCGIYKGAIVGVPADGKGKNLSYVVGASRQAGIWAPPGVVVDSKGSLFAALGNAAVPIQSQRSVYNHGDAVVRLTPDLREVDLWAPANWEELDAADKDVGSTTPVLLGGGLLFQGGKSGVGYLLNRDHLGGIGKEAFQAPVCQAIIFGGVVYVAATQTLYLGCGPAFTIALKLSGARFDVLWKVSSGGETPILAYGSLWSVSRSSKTLIQLDPGSGKVLAKFPLGSTEHFATAAAAGGRVFVPASTKLIAIGPG